MSVHFIIDGYNLINRRGGCFPSSLRSARRKLINLIEKNRPQGSARNKVTVIFDGQPGVTSPPEKKVRVIYTRGAEADQYIEKEVIDSSNPATVIAVTDDRGLRKKVTSAGGKVMPVKEFSARLFHRGKKFSESSPGEKITPEEQREINRLMEKKWNK